MKKRNHCLFFLSVISVVQCMTKDTLSSDISIKSQLSSQLKDHRELVESFARKFQELLRGIENLIFIDAAYRKAAEKAPGTHMQPQEDLSSGLNSSSSSALSQLLSDLVCITNQCLSINSKFDPNTIDIAEGFSREQVQETYYKFQRAIEFIENGSLNEDHQEDKISYFNAVEKFKDIHNILCIVDMEFIDINQRICSHAIKYKIIEQASENLCKENNYDKDVFLIYALIRYHHQKLHRLDIIEYFFLKDNSKCSQILKQATTFINHIIANKPVKDIKIDFLPFREMISRISDDVYSDLNDICHENPVLNQNLVSKKCVAIWETKNLNEVYIALVEVKKAFDFFKKKANEIELSEQNLRNLSDSKNNLDLIIILYEIIYASKMRNLKFLTSMVIRQCLSDHEYLTDYVNKFLINEVIARGA